MTDKAALPHLIEQEATVVRVHAGRVVLEARRRSSCSACSNSAGCGTSLIAELLGEGSTRLELTDTLGLAQGERVLVGISQGALNLASVLVYLAPLVALIATAVVIKELGGSDASAALGGLAGLVAALVVAQRLVAATRHDTQPRLIRKLTPWSHLPQLRPSNVINQSNTTGKQS